MLKEREIRDRLASYLAGALPLRDFSAWLYGESLDMEGSSPRAQALVYAILGRLAERSSAGFSESKLRAWLLPLADSFTLVEEQPEVRTESSSEVLLPREVPVAP